MRVAVLLCLTFLTLPCWADGLVVQTEDQRNLGRVVIPLGSSRRAIIRHHDSEIEVILPSKEEIATPDTVPRNVVSIVGGTGRARVTKLPGTRYKATNEARAVVVEVFDPSGRARLSELTASSRPNPAKPTAILDVPEVAAKPSQAEVQPPSVPPIAQAPMPPEPAADQVVEAPLAPPSRPIVRSFSVRAGAETGMASFRRNGKGVVVFDEAVTMDGADDVEGGLTPVLEVIQRGTLVTVPLAPDEALNTTRSEDSITVTIGPPVGSPAVAAAIPTGIQFQVSRPGRVMAISDPVTGQTMLIGTTRQLDGERAMIGTGRSAPGYVLLPTWLGVALETSSDRIDLKVAATSYTLAIADKSATNAVAQAPQANQFGIPVASPEMLVRQLSAQIASAAAAPPRGRGPERVSAARTMLALGMSAEAQALLTLAATDDPAVARDPETAALLGIAAVLAGRPGSAGGLDNPALPTGGDLALWRGLRDLDEGRPAPALAGAWPLLSAYPDAVRRQITPPVMEAAVANSADIPASELEGPALALARALKLDHDGQTDAAIEALTAVKDSRDERSSVRAAIALAELRLRAGRGSPAETAEQLERQTVRWRGGVQEVSLRLRAAELRSNAGQWRAALDGLRETQNLFPERKDAVAEARTNVFRSLLSAAPTAIAPLELVLVAGEFADGFPAGEDGDRLSGLLADKLAALDLPMRAIPILKNLKEKAGSANAKAEIGLRLAQMQIDAGEPAAAQALLSGTDFDGGPTAQEVRRTILLSRAKAAQGDFAGAAAGLLTVSTPEADDMRANFYAKAGDWQRSFETLDGIIASTVPETGELVDKQQELILRSATAAVQAGNAEALRRLSRFERRMTAPRADLFRVLTASVIKGPEDLPRASRELAMSKALPDRLNALKAR